MAPSASISSTETASAANESIERSSHGSSSSPTQKTISAFCSALGLGRAKRIAMRRCALLHDEVGRADALHHLGDKRMNGGDIDRDARARRPRRRS